MTAVAPDVHHRRSGGGLRISASSPTIRDCIIRDNAGRAGQPGYVHVGGIHMDRVLYSRRPGSGGNGGGVFVNAGASPLFERCEIRDNRVGLGAPCALFNGNEWVALHAPGAPSHGWVYVSYCYHAAAADGFGAGVAMNHASAVFVDCEIESNENGGGVFVGPNSFLAMRDSTLADNDEGILMDATASIDLRRCRVTGHRTSTGDGFAIELIGAHHFILSCLIDNNDHAFGNAATPVLLKHCSIVDNSQPTFLVNGSEAHNCILWNELDPTLPASSHSEWPNWGPSTIVESCLFRGTPHPGPGNITSPDVGFVDAANGDYHLRWDSPAVNAGQTGVISPNNTDIDGQPRRLGSGFDMGADEAVCVGLGRLEDPAASGETLDLSWIEGQTSTPLTGELVGGGADPNALGVAALAPAPGMATQGNLTLHLDAGNLLAGFISFDANGEFRLPLDVDDPSVAGSVIYLQLFATGASGVRSSNGLEITFCN